MARKVLVCGGRDFSDRDFVFATLDSRLAAEAIAELIVGFDPADPRPQWADRLAFEWATDRGVPVRCFPANWKAFGRAAGPRRNTEMQAERPDECIAFPGGTGTADMMVKALRIGAELFQPRP